MLILGPVTIAQTAHSLQTSLTDSMGCGNELDRFELVGIVLAIGYTKSKDANVHYLYLEFEVHYGSMYPRPIFVVLLNSLTKWHVTFAQILQWYWPVRPAVYYCTEADPLLNWGFSHSMQLRLWWEQLPYTTRNRCTAISNSTHNWSIFTFQLTTRP